MTIARVCFIWFAIFLVGSHSSTIPSFQVDTKSVSDLPEHSQADEDATGNSAFKLSLLPSTEKHAESVNLEHEGLPSKILSIYDSSQRKVVSHTNPIPILDTISEHEKYGNTGDMFDGISRTIVEGYEIFSNLLNKLIEGPKLVARSLSKGLTAQLDKLGGKLVGL